MIRTRFTEAFGLDHPVALAPMDGVSGGRLAAAVSHAGGLGLIGGGYADARWLERELGEAGNAPVGVGFITWAALKAPQAVAAALDRRPAAVMVSFGDAEPIVAQAKAAGVPILWQVQRLEQARQALAAEADVIVVQGQEAGGHGMDRGLMSLLPAVRDLAGPERMVLGAGGIADGRGLAAALSLGADGVLVGTRFWASREALGAEAAKRRMLEAGGDDTVRSKVFDVARGVDWPWHFSGRVLRNGFLEEWHGRERRMTEAAAEAYAAAPAEDYDTRVVIAGEALDLIDDLPPAGEIVRRMAEAAEAILRAPPRARLG